MTLSNHQGNVSLRLKYFDDFTSARVTRIKSMLKYLDSVNFPNQLNPHGDPDPESFTKDVYFVNQKVRRLTGIVEFELVSALEIEMQRYLVGLFILTRVHGTIGQKKVVVIRESPSQTTKGRGLFKRI